jgi:hypothetical protein
MRFKKPKISITSRHMHEESGNDDDNWFYLARPVGVRNEPEYQMFNSLL